MSLEGIFWHGDSFSFDSSNLKRQFFEITELELKHNFLAKMASFKLNTHRVLTLFKAKLYRFAIASPSISTADTATLDNIDIFPVDASLQ